MGSEGLDFGSERPDLWSERPDLGSGRPDLRVGEQNTGLEKLPCVESYRSSAPPAPLPKREKGIKK